MSDASDTLNLDDLRSKIFSKIRDNLNVITNRNFPNQITLNLIMPGIFGRSTREVNDAFDAAVWSLVADGIIVPGTKSTVSGGIVEHTPGAHGYFPYFRLTPFGQMIVSRSDGADPYDRTAYLAAAVERLPDSPDVIFTYLAEAERNFLSGAYLSATVMLGVSAEGLMQWLLARLLEHAPGARGRRYKEKFAKVKFRTHQLFEQLISALHEHWAELPTDLCYQADAYLSQLITIIRINRDDVAHGRATRVDRQLVHGNLLVYLSLMKIVGQVWSNLKPGMCSLPFTAESTS